MKGDAVNVHTCKATPQRRDTALQILDLTSGAVKREEGWRHHRLPCVRPFRVRVLRGEASEQPRREQRVRPVLLGQECVVQDRPPLRLSARGDLCRSAQRQLSAWRESVSSTLAECQPAQIAGRFVGAQVRQRREQLRQVVLSWLACEDIAPPFGLRRARPERLEVVPSPRGVDLQEGPPGYIS